LQEVIFEKYKFEGIAEILDMYSSIVAGFALPLRDEHINFFILLLIPLHKV